MTVVPINSPDSYVSLNNIEIQSESILIGARSCPRNYRITLIII